jgi:hypothetical protein
MDLLWKIMVLHQFKDGVEADEVKPKIVSQA